MSNTLDSVIGTTQLYQDVELATAIAQLKSDPAQLQAFLQNTQSKVYDKITQQKTDTFQKVYGDLGRAGKVQEAVLMYNKRTQDLVAVQDDIYATQKEKTDAVVEDKQTAGRKGEMNEWTVNNKRDTLFVMSSLFIMLSAFLLFTGLWRMQMLSATTCLMMAVPLLLIFILIVVNRSQYTDILRNKRYWNKKDFPGKYGTVTSGCPSTSIASIAGGAQGLAAGAIGGVGSMMHSLGQNLTGAGENVQHTGQQLAAQ